MVGLVEVFLELGRFLVGLCRPCVLSCQRGKVPETDFGCSFLEGVCDRVSTVVDGFHRRGGGRVELDIFEVAGVVIVEDDGCVSAISCPASWRVILFEEARFHHGSADPDVEGRHVIGWRCHDKEAGAHVCPFAGPFGLSLLRRGVRGTRRRCFSSMFVDVVGLLCCLVAVEEHCYPRALCLQEFCPDHCCVGSHGRGVVVVRPVVREEVVLAADGGQEVRADVGDECSPGFGARDGVVPRLVAIVLERLDGLAEWC